MQKIIIAIILAVSAGSAFAENVTLMGAGATFPEPLYKKMFAQYYKDKKIEVNYQGIGSGGGIQQLISRTVDFGASDAPMNDKEAKGAKGDVLHVPTCLGAVVLAYNLPGNPAVKLTPEVLSGIFMGTITKWNDPKLAAINEGVTLPNLAIVVVHRSDGSGTTYTFSEYMTAVSEEWKKKVGTGKSLNWPVGIGGKGNPGVAGYVKQVPGAIGYIEVAYAKQNKIAYASLKNKSGKFIEATLASVAAAADVDLPADMKVSLVDTAAVDGYPICTFTWILIYQELGEGGRPKDRAVATVNMLWWLTHEGQAINETLDYGKLSPKAVANVEKMLKSATYQKKPILN